MGIVLFWLCVLLLVYTYAGYPSVVAIRATWFPRQIKAAATFPCPDVSVVIVAYNEEQRIQSRIKNLLESQYPADRLHITFISDGSTDNSIASIRDMKHSRVQILDVQARAGKASGLNTGVAAANSEIIVFADARQRFTPDTIPNLVRHFSNPEIGAVSGALMIDPAASSVGGGVDAYWKLEKIIRENESCFDSSIGCTGAVYAIRQDLFQPIPSDTVLDDVIIPMQIAMQGYRVVFDPLAVAFDPQPLDPERETIRKRRTLAGNFQMLFRYPAWLFPWRNRLWCELISHKYLRLLAPFLMIGALGSNALLLNHPVYRVYFYAQSGFYFMAVIGLVFSSLKIRILSLPAGFVFLNWMALRGFWHYLTTPRFSNWQTARAKE